ncbi:MAG: ABC transporter permease [Lachnospiraceae bacterium]|nr:ABC transporter permease [Lachnospiraceae bacterium]
MRNYLQRKLLGMLPLLLLVSAAAFALVRLMPGDAATAYLNAMNAPITEAALQKVQKDLGLDKPVAVQYGIWLKQALSLDFGLSYMTKRPVIDELMRGFYYTAVLTGSAVVWIIVFSLPLGILAGRHPGSFMDQIIRAMTFLGSSIPSFWLGFLLVEFFSLRLKLLPVQGAGTLKHILLPSITLACSYLAMYTKMLRGGIVEHSGRTYVLYARARGLKKKTILWRHILPNALNPVLTSLGLSLGSMLSGAVIVENVFAWPGMGRVIVHAVAGRDYPVIQGYILVIAAVYIVLNLGVDILCAMLNPGIFTEEET